MYCPTCGWRNADGVARCGNCRQELQAAQAGAPRQPQEAYGSQPYAQDPFGSVPDYLVWSILVTVFCCMPFGIVAIVKSAEANSKRDLGDYDGAMRAAQSARMWTFLSLGIVFAPFVIFAALAIVCIIAGTKV